MNFSQNSKLENTEYLDLRLWHVICSQAKDTAVQLYSWTAVLIVTNRSAAGPVPQLTNIAS